MKFGCSTLLLGGYDLATALDGLRTAGYEAVELCAIPGMGEHFKGGEAPEVYTGMRQQLDAAGLALESVGCSGALGTERFVPLMEAAAALGAPCMTLGTGGTSDDEESWAQAMATVRAALPVCERTGVRLSVKPHVRAAVYNVATAERFLAEMPSEWVGLNLDNTHLQRAGDDPIAAVATLRDRVFTARIRDYLSEDLSIGPIENQIPGKGQANVRGYFQALTQVPGLETVVVEMVGAKDFPLPEIQRIIGETLTALRSYQ
jgi:sugar phosphate isomerase/epimerase